MKIKDLTQEQIQYLADNRPVWMRSFKNESLIDKLKYLMLDDGNYLVLDGEYELPHTVLNQLNKSPCNMNG